ncbi:SlyX family protein [Chelativorans sp. Marseille-P2723]|uniref:SlyX family protein n=1 Tax=Chelativorans sp. Marseille-P2723 TaxID=2709133 RepID=UPI00156D4510|nr:SlyX family protein [Chelativorans sp. Marseille-P2723]
MPEDRLDKLEMAVAEQEHMIEELSGQLAKQWIEIDLLRRKLALLTERFLALEQQATPSPPVTKPPHW